MPRRSIALAFLIVLLALPAWATEFRTGRTVSIEPGEVIDDDLFAFANNVLIAGEVKGDLFAAGETVRVTGTVDGSVMAGGRKVLITGDVGNSVRAGGQSVTLSGPIGRNAAVAGNDVLLSETGHVRRDLHAAGNILNLDGSVAGRAGLAGQTVTVRGRVEDDLRFEGGELVLQPTAKIGGDLVYRSDEAAEIAPGATIGGETRMLAPRAPSEAREPRFPLASVILFFLVVFVFGLVGLAAAPRLFTGAANAMARRPWWNLLLGFLTLIAVPIAAMLVCVTVIGLPLGVLALVAWGAAFMFSGVPVATFLGQRLLSPRTGGVSPYLGLFLGLLVLTLVGLVPYLGPLTKVLTVLFGMGVYARAAKGALAEMRAQPA
jgi:cytoskeletal protein CcmA (bactofilin family)